MSQTSPQTATRFPSVPAATPEQAVGQGETLLKQIIRRFLRNKLAVAGLIVIVGLIGIALFADWISPYEPTDLDLFNINGAPSAQHWMGTDELGRDELSRVIHATRVSLSVGLAAMGISVIVGTFVGALAGHFGGWIDNLLMRFVDVMLSFPTIFLLIIMAARFRPTVVGMITIIGLTSWMGVSRLVRGEFLALKNREFTEAARALGVRDGRLILRHLLPNSLSPIIVAATLGVGGAILSESALSYLGIGIQPPIASWGNMLTNAQDYVINAPWLAFYPGFMIFITVLAFNFVGDGLRDALDPKQKRG